MYSSTRFRNSGENFFLSASITARRCRSSSVVGLPCAKADVALAELRRADVAGHDDDGVAEVDRAPVAVRQPTVLQYLEHDVEHVRVSLLDLVEEHDAEGPAAHRLGQLSCLVVADVAGRRADEAGDGVALRELGHVHTHHVLLIVEQAGRQRARKLRLSDARGAEEHERAHRALLVAQAGARTAYRVGDGDDGVVLADNPLVQTVLQVQEALGLLLHQPGRRGCRSTIAMSVAMSSERTTRSVWSRPRNSLRAAV